MSVEFEDYKVRVKAAMKNAALNFLEEASGEIHAAAVRIMDSEATDTGDTKGSFRHVVDESSMEATVGSPAKNAIWTELGTGEYALEGKGRKGGWYIPIGEGVGQISQVTVDKYRFKVVYGKNGLKYAYTEGRKPIRMLHRAFENKKTVIKRRAEQLFGRME